MFWQTTFPDLLQKRIETDPAHHLVRAISLFSSGKKPETSSDFPEAVTRWAIYSLTNFALDSDGNVAVSFSRESSGIVRIAELEEFGWNNVAPRLRLNVEFVDYDHDEIVELAFQPHKVTLPDGIQRWFEENRAVLNVKEPSLVEDYNATLFRR